MVDTDRNAAPDARKRAACTWCDAPSGRRGVTLRKVTVADRQHRMHGVLLCQSCFDELKRFGRQLTFLEWRRLYVRHVLDGLAHSLRVALHEAVRLSPGLRELVAWLSPRRHWRIVASHHRYRTREW